jgi:L-ascorbate metabolism protein UlaG (beta-lactamase superfamily)
MGTHRACMYGRPIGATVTYAGHATVVLDLPCGRLVTDPVLRDRIGYLQRVAAPVASASLEAVDAVLVSHVHHDHLDGPSLRRLGTDIPVVAPAGARALLVSKGVRTVLELLPGEHATVAGLRVTATPADHQVRRLPGGRLVPAVGYVVEGPPRVYFAGDTDLFDGMSAIGDLELDLALLPITGWGPRTPPGHLDPVRAARALALLRPRMVVPIHWGTLAPVWWRQRPPETLRAAADVFEREAAAVAPDVDVRVLAPGEALELVPAPRS